MPGHAGGAAEVQRLGLRGGAAAGGAGLDSGGKGRGEQAVASKGVGDVAV